MQQVSAKSEYACAAVFELASVYSRGELLQVRKIADAQKIPSKFLVQILLQLKAAGLVTSTRGACGGYRLARDPNDITVWDVHCIIDGLTHRPRETTRRLSANVLNDVWREASHRSRDVLQSTTFAQLLARTDEQAMYYI